MRCDHLVIHTFGVECIALSMFWMMWFIGTAIATVSRSPPSLRESNPDPSVMINVHRRFGVTWVGAISIRHAVSSLPSWRSRGSAGLFYSYCSASHSSIRSSIEHGRTRCMGTSILVIVLSLHNRLSIARAAFETRLLVISCTVQYINESYCKDDIYILRG
jgi:hypothetical protein